MRIALIIFAAFALTGAATAASQTVWYATKKQVARELTYNWTTSDHVRVRISRCQGMGRAIYNRLGRQMFHRFACAELDYLDRIIYLRVTVTGPKPGNERVTEVRCDNSRSDYKCP
jgi:hypothetical protein